MRRFFIMLILILQSYSVVCPAVSARTTSEQWGAHNADTLARLRPKLDRYVLDKCEKQKGHIQYYDDFGEDAGVACYVAEAKSPENLGVCLRLQLEGTDETCAKVLLEKTHKFICSDLKDPDEFAYCFSLLFPVAYFKGLIPEEERTRLRTEKMISLKTGEVLDHSKYAAAGFTTDGPEYIFAEWQLFSPPTYEARLKLRSEGQNPGVVEATRDRELNRCFEKDYDYAKALADWHLKYWSPSPFKRIKDQFIFVKKCVSKNQAVDIYFDVFSPYQ